MKHSDQKVYGNDGNPDVIQLIPKVGKLTVLDIGCGDGSIARRLNNGNYTVDGITISEDEKQYASKYMREVYVFNLENGLPFAGENLYDVVICSHVLEHICYPKNLLTAIYKVLKPGGSIIVALPNLMHYKSRFQLMLGNFNYTETGIWDYTHFRWYTFKTGAELLKSYKFEIKIATVTGELPLNSLFSRIFPPALRTGIYNFLKKISKGFFGYQLLYMATKPA